MAENTLVVSSEDPLEQLLFQQQIADLRLQSKNELIRAAFRKKVRDDIANGRECDYMKMALQFIDRSYFIDNRCKPKDQRTFFVTINAKDDIDVVQFWAQMKKCEKKTLLKSVRGRYVIEQRSEGDQEPYGWHIHWLVEFEKHNPKSAIVQQVYQCFKNYVAGANYIDVRLVVGEDAWKMYEKYISGEKKEEKMGKVQKDIILREKYQLV